MILTKICTKCKAEKPVTEFYKSQQTKDGFRYFCIKCGNARSTEERKYHREYRQTKRLLRTKEQIDKDREYQRIYQENRKKNDPLFKLGANIRTLICNSIAKLGQHKSLKSELILGCSLIEFKHHIESQFTEGMTWDNYGKWEFDHKVPVSWGQSELEVIALNHYTNFQPLWKTENSSKRNRYSH